MFQYRQVLVRLRRGDTERDIARSGLMGRPKVKELREVATREGWLAPEAPLPEDEAIVQALGAARRASSTISSVEPFRDAVSRWVSQGVSGVAIHAALKREHGYAGSYSSVYRMVSAIRAVLPPDVTVPLSFAPAEAAQVDFGAGPVLFDAAEGRPRRTWCFVMTLCWSRHQYVEFVWDQTVATWLGCHRRAFEWFGAVPERLIIDNPKCAITRACIHDPMVQRAYAEAAEGYGFRIDPCPPADPQKKGVVEAGVKYVKGNFLPTRTFRDLHDLIAERYEQTATVVTSNLDFTEWDQAFPANRLLASATLDRLRHNAYCLVLDGQSYRAPKLAPASIKSKVANNSKSTHS
jgi:transposase